MIKNPVAVALTFCFGLGPVFATALALAQERLLLLKPGEDGEQAEFEGLLLEQAKAESQVIAVQPRASTQRNPSVNAAIPNGEEASDNVLPVPIAGKALPAAAAIVAPGAATGPQSKPNNVRVPRQ